MILISYGRLPVEVTKGGTSDGGKEGMATPVNYTHNIFPRWLFWSGPFLPRTNRMGRLKADNMWRHGDLVSGRFSYRRI